ncbi:MAG: Type 1 glutamine amidotransferase-like domain-containing protein [Bacteroidota bacterium]
MKYYLSSYKFGNRLEDLKRLRPQNPKIGHINNSRDWVGADPKRATKHQNDEIEILNSIGFIAESIDLKKYFGKIAELRKKLNSLGGIWVSGGNTFVLRMAMKLSGFDKIFDELIKREDFLYGGYSAGICVLSESLESIDIVDDPRNFPYEGITEPIYEGLGVFNYSFMPHYDSDHFESEAIGKEIQRCINNKWLFKALRDGDVLIID